MTRVKEANILQVISASDIGGGQRHLLTLLEWFTADSTFRFKVVCRPDGPLRERFETLGLPVEPLALNDFVDLRSIYQLYKTLKGGVYHLAHAHLNRACIYTSLAARLAGVPVVCTAHGMTKAIYYRFATHIIAVSNAVKANLVAQRPELEGKIRVIHNGIPLNTSADGRMVKIFRQQYYIKDHEKIVGVLGTFHDNKGQDVALRALKKIPESANVRLVMAGDGPAKAKIQNLAKVLALGTRVLILPATNYVNEFLTMCDIVLVPSIKEAFSLVVLEALLLGRPVIAANTGGIPEIIEDGRQGQLFPPGDADRLAQLIVASLKDYRRIERMSAEGPPHVLQHFTHNRMGNEVRGLYKEILSAR